MLEKIVTNSRSRGYLICFVSVAILSMDSFFIRHVDGVKFLTFLCYRDLFASFAFGVLLSIDSSFSTTSGLNIFKRIRSIDWRAAAAIMMVCVYSFTFAMALRYGVVAISLVIIASTPLFASIFSWVFIGESIGTSTKIASLACAGAIIYVTVASVDGKALSGAENLVVGNICAVVCAIATGAFFALLRYCVVVAQQPADIQVIMTSGFLLTALLAAAGGAGLSPITATDALFLFLQGCVSVTVGYFGLSMSTMLLTSTEVSMCMLLETILGPAIVYLGGYDRVPMPAVYGGIVIVSSLAFNSFAVVGFEKDSCCDDTVDSKETKGDLETDSEKGSDTRVGQGHECDLNEAFVADDSIESVDAYICSLAQAKNNNKILFPQSCCHVDKDDDFLNSARRASTVTTASIDTLDENQHPKFSASRHRFRLGSHDEVDDEDEYSDDEWGYAMDVRPPTNTLGSASAESGSERANSNSRVPTIAGLFGFVGIAGIAFEKSYPQLSQVEIDVGEIGHVVDKSVHTVEGSHQEGMSNIHRGGNVDNGFQDCNV